ncbi:MAG: hypothetical protein HYS21_00070 [Deltaproteobacteria bacterium]|nr:hypothetical protein [Deltaproteobacteria bacterium]
MKYLLSALIIVATITLFYAGLHAYEDITVIKCDVPVSSSEVAPMNVDYSIKPIEANVTEARNLRTERRALSVPDWAVKEQ